MPTPRALPKMLQHLFPVSLRQIEVEKHEVRAGRVLVDVGTVEKLYCGIAVSGDLNVGIDLRAAKGFLNQEQVIPAVLGKKDPAFPHGHLTAGL